MNKPKPKLPTPSLLQGRPYVPHTAQHCVQDTWKKFGWQPAKAPGRPGIDWRSQ